MSARCDLTDLLVEMCAHCLGHREHVDAIDPGSIAVQRTMLARFDGRCALDARHPIEVDDRIGLTEHGWVCGRCAGIAGDRP